MNWLRVTVVAAAVLFLVSRYGRKIPFWEGIEKRIGKNQPTDRKGTARAEEALDSDDLEKMIDALEQTDRPAYRHRLLVRIAQSAYTERTDPKIRKLLFLYARMHVKEYPHYGKSVTEDRQAGGASPPTFKMLAIALEEEGRFDEAIAVSRKALQMNIDDGTKTGFAGRIVRLEKKRDRVAA
jgi:tetratricopeptide (TPR) repeat protein